ncbi:unnamed protein product [Plasmodium vivax]|uniref:(malaria parasite P. vivax) hypothetical protein n=1 Tax=Plasmodium vivax TaxID=5855 RepID=A0A8S4HI79_PLAVI|nr:unnamed protein product [Plasmodium vivax]
MSLLCHPDAVHLLVEDDLGSFLSSLEKERRPTSQIVILTDQATLLNERPTILATLKFFLRHPRDHSKGSLSPEGGRCTLQGKLQKGKHVDETKWSHPLVFPSSDDGDHLGEKYTHSSSERSANQDGKKGRSRNQTEGKAAHQMVLCEAKQGTTHLPGGTDPEELQQLFEKFEQSLGGKAIFTPHLFSQQIKNVLVIISNVKKWDDKVEVAQQLNELFGRDTNLREAQVICFASEHMLESVYHLRGVLCRGLKVHLFPASGRALVAALGGAAVKADRYDEAVHADEDDPPCSNTVTLIRGGLLTSLREGDCKGIFAQVLKLAILNDPKLFTNIKSSNLTQFKKRIKCFLHKLLKNSCDISRRGRRNKKIMNMFRFGTTIGNAIKSARGNPLNGVFTNEQMFLCYGIYYELRILYEVHAVDLISLIDVKEIMMKYKTKYKLSKNYLDYHTHEIMHHLRKAHPSERDKICLVHLTGIGEVHPDVLISIPLSVVCRVLCPMVCFPPRSMHFSRKGTEPTHTWESFVHIEHVGNKSEAIRMIYVSCMSRENTSIGNVTACLDVVVFVKILKEINFDIRLTRQGVATHPEDLSPGGNVLHIRGNIQRSAFLFKRFTYRRGITLNVYNCGTVCRFILPLLCLYICKQNLKAKRRKKRVLKWVLLKGSKQMETTRIIGPLVQVLRQTFKCVNIEYTKKENYLPICISVKEGANLEGRLFCTEYVRIDNYHSSQFVSAMLLLSAFSETDTRLALSFKRVGRGGTASRRDGRGGTPRGRAAQRRIDPRPNGCVSCCVGTLSSKPLHHTANFSLPAKPNETASHPTQRVERTTHQFSTTSKSFIDLTIRVMKLWGVQVRMKNFCYVLKKGGRYPSYGRGRSKVALRKSVVTRVKRFICVLRGVPPTGGNKGGITKRGREEGEALNSPVRLPVDVNGEEEDLELSRLINPPICAANSAPSCEVQNDLGLLIYFIIGCLIRGENCAIDVGLRLDGVDLYPVGGAGGSRQSGQGEESEPIPRGSHDPRYAHHLSSPSLRRIKAVRRQANIPNYALLNVLLLLGVDIYVEEGGSPRRSKKVYLLTSKRMSIRQEFLRRLLPLGVASKGGEKNPVGAVKRAKWEVFQNVHLKVMPLSSRMLLNVVVDVESFSDDFFSLSVLFCYYLLVHPTECFSFRIKNVRNQNVKESVRVYNAVIILKLFFQNVLFISCDRNSVYIDRMTHPVENCLFYRMSKKGELPSGEAPSEAASPTGALLGNNSKYVTNDRGEVYLYVDTQRDHRIIFMVAILSLLGGNVLIDNNGEVEKSFPHFFDYAHGHLGLNVRYATCGGLSFCSFAKLCGYSLMSGGGGSPSEEPPSNDRSSPRSNPPHGSTKVENPPRGNQVKCIHNLQQRGANNVAMKMGGAELGKKLHDSMDHWTTSKGSRGDETKFTHGQAEDPPSNGDDFTDSSSHLEMRHPCEEADGVDAPIGEMTFAERGRDKCDEDVKGGESKITDSHESRIRGGTTCEGSPISANDQSKWGGRQKRERSMLVPPRENPPLKDTCGEACDRTPTHGRGALPRDPNYWREYHYEELLHGNDADILHLINQVNRLNVHIICGIRNVGKSYLSKRVKTSSLVIDLDEFILDGPIRFDRLSIDDFRYYEYVTFVSTLYLAYLIFAEGNGHQGRGGNPMQGDDIVHQGIAHSMGTTEEAQAVLFENTFLSLQEDVHFNNKKVNRLYHTMKGRHFLTDFQVPVRSVTIVLGGGIVEFEKSRQVMQKMKNLLLIRRPPREIYHLCINDRVKPPLRGNLQEIISRRTALFASLNAFHFAIPPEESIKRCLKNANMSRDQLIVSSFLNFFNYQFFVKPAVKHSYGRAPTTGEGLLSLRLSEFSSFDCASLGGTYEVVELVLDCPQNGGEPNGEGHKADLLELAIFTIRSYTDKPICVKFPKWVLYPNWWEPPNEGPPGGQKNPPYRCTPTDLCKYKINLFDVDAHFFKRVGTFMPREREHLFIVISSYRERVHKGRVATDLHKLDKWHADLIRLTFARATHSDRETLHREITRHYAKRLGNHLISHVRGVRRMPCYDVPPHQVAHQRSYEISVYTEQNDPLVFLCNDVSHVGCPQQGVAAEEKGRRPHHPESYMHSFYRQGVKTIISCVPR